MTTSQCKERIPLAGKGERGEPRKVGIRMKCECRIFAYVVESKICCKKDYCKVNGVQDEEAEVAFLILMWGVFFFTYKTIPAHGSKIQLIKTQKLASLLPVIIFTLAQIITKSDFLQICSWLPLQL